MSRFFNILGIAGFIFSLFALLVIGINSFKPLPQPPSYLLNYSAKILITADGGIIGSGSGVVIGHITDKQGLSHTIIVTCAHVVTDHKTVAIVLNKVNLKSMKANIVDPQAKVLFVDSNNDVALVETDKYFPSVPIFSNRLPDGTQETEVGAPLGSNLVITQGYISYVNENMIEGTAPTLMGNSGGGVYTYINNKWQLIGIAEAILSFPIGKGGPEVTHPSDVVAMIPASTTELIITSKVINEVIKESGLAIDFNNH